MRNVSYIFFLIDARGCLPDADPEISSAWHAVGACPCSWLNGAELERDRFRAVSVSRVRCERNAAELLLVVTVSMVGDNVGVAPRSASVPRSPRLRKQERPCPKRTVRALCDLTNVQHERLCQRPTGRKGRL